MTVETSPGGPGSSVLRHTVPTPSATGRVADAVIVLGFGGPEGPDEVWPFLDRVAAGRGIPRERLAVVAEHYQRFGGISPINGHNRELTSEITARLSERGIEVPVVLAHRNTPPYAADVLAALVADLAPAAHDPVSVVALATSAYPSYSGCRQYREDLGQGLVDAGLSQDDRVTVRKIPPFFALDGMSVAATDLVRAGLDEAAAAGSARPVVLFTTHSLPSAGARASGTAAQASDEAPDVYSAAHLAVAASVMKRSGSDAPWRLVYQSRSGSPTIPWLEPDVLDVLPELRADGHDAVVVMPIGFLSDHIEVLWDLDVQAAECAAEHGLTFVRVPTVGTHPAFLDAVADLVAWHVSGGQTAAPRWADGIPAPTDRWCGETCCLLGRPTRSGQPAGTARPSVDPSRPGGHS